MNDVEFLADQLRRAHNGQAWHGPSLRECLQGVSAGMAASRPSAEVHSIWEIAQHIAAWLAAVGLRLDGQIVELAGERDWPPAGSGEAAWQKTLADLDREAERLQETISKLPPEGLRKGVPGQGSVRFMLEGVIQHHLYHAGQIALLKKMVAR
jgi:DinB superfamily